MCRQQSEQTNLKTNLLLKNLVSIARNANLFQFLKSEEQWCGTHKEIKEIFCDADKSLLCLLCSQTDEHGDHRHLPTEEAAEEYWVSDASRALGKLNSTAKGLKDMIIVMVIKCQVQM